MPVSYTHLSGLAINMLMLGVTSFLFKLMSNGQGYQQIETFPNIAIPGLSKIPLIGDAFFNCDFLTYILYVLLILTWIFYKKTNLGLSFMAVGEHPRAAESAGIQVKKYRWIVMVFNGILGGIGGAYLVLVQLGVFTENMISGRGYIALATVILGRYTPFGMFGAALLFGAANALQIRLQTIGVSISPFLLAILPYEMCIRDRPSAGHQFLPSLQLLCAMYGWNQHPKRIPFRRISGTLQSG